MTDDLRDDALRILALPAKIGQTYNNLVASHCAHILALRNKYIGINLLVVRHNKPKIFIFLVKTHQSLVCALQHLDDCALRAFSLCCRACCDLHRIAMHGILRFFCRNKHVLVHALHGHKTKAFCMTAKSSDHGKCLRLSVFAALGKANLAVCHQGIQNFF